VRSWASSIRWDQAFPLQGPCAVNPLRAVPRRGFTAQGPCRGKAW
jgi:hypothetical protein